jgi:hypothetical protein
VTALARLVPLDAPKSERFAGPAFAPYRELAAPFVVAPRFPTADELNTAFAERIDQALGPRTVRFDAQRGKRRGRLASLEDAYEARIDARGLVPTRACLHDFANALVWARFPRSKRELAGRQHRALRRDVPEFRGTLPNARSEERDVLSMLDEGGILIAGDETFVFGHAILEHLASSDAEVYGFPIEVAGADLDAIDRELAASIADESRWRTRDQRAIAVRARLRDPARSCA